MDLTEAMRTQHACRYYKPDPVPDSVFHAAIDNARFGPQGGNRQPVRFLIVRDPDKRAQLAEWYRIPWKQYIAAMREGQASLAATSYRSRLRGRSEVFSAEPCSARTWWNDMLPARPMHGTARSISVRIASGSISPANRPSSP